MIKQACPKHYLCTKHHRENCCKNWESRKLDTMCIRIRVNREEERKWRNYDSFASVYKNPSYKQISFESRKSLYNLFEKWKPITNHFCVAKVTYEPWHWPDGCTAKYVLLSLMSRFSSGSVAFPPSQFSLSLLPF